MFEQRPFLFSEAPVGIFLILRGFLLQKRYRSAHLPGTRVHRWDIDTSIELLAQMHRNQFFLVFSKSVVIYRLDMVSTLSTYWYNFDAIMGILKRQLTTLTSGLSVLVCNWYLKEIL
jgi:hypothetical protein